MDDDETIRPRQLTIGERNQLRQFVRVVESMSRRRFIETFRSQDHTLHCLQEVAGPQYDREDFEAFLTDFRKVAMSKSEPVYLTKVLGTVGKYATEKLRENLGQFRSCLVPLLEGGRTLMTYSFQREGKTISMSLRQVLSALVNGEIFHVDPVHAEAAMELRTTNELHYLWPTLHFFVVPVVQGCIWMYHAIRRDGILDESDYPPRTS